MSKHLGDRLIDYAWETLDDVERGQAERHLDECAVCRAELARHQALVRQVADAIPARLSRVTPRTSAGWPKVAARLAAPAARQEPRPRRLPGFVVAGLVMSVTMTVLVVMLAQAWIGGWGRPPLTATTLHTTTQATPLASATYTPTHSAALATPPDVQPWAWAGPYRWQEPRPRQIPMASTASQANLASDAREASEASTTSTATP